ncbi:MAG TPA: MASE1 domain-containing protein [Steroidobacteraceae bacterium]|nr:MASE1 domain-containing protein [Steroidobacteraceae bacterium]
MSMPAMVSDNRNPELVWDFMRGGIARRALSLAAFAALYTVLVLLGLDLRESSRQLTILWPAAGLLVMALWFAPLRNWAWIIAIQLAVEFALAAVRIEHFDWSVYLPFPFANTIDAVVGALLARRWIANPEIPKIRHVLRFIAAVAIGAAASALLGASGSARPLAGAFYLREWQLWWAGNWLGSLCVAPVVVGWAVRWHARAISAPPAPVMELVLIGGALFGMTAWVFSAPPGSASTILDLPFVVLALLIVAAFRLPPRWCTSFAALTALIAAYFASRGTGPFEGDANAFVRVGATQLFLAALVVVDFMLATVLFEMRKAMRQLHTAVTELAELNEQLRRKQDRLKSYARQLVGAEERARRATAVDLHDGIGQQLVGLAMTLDAVNSRTSPDVRLLLGEATHTVREVQAITQRVIADLSPPGLYELGLEPALKWLSVYMRGKDNLQVDLRVTADDSRFDLDLRVLVFKLIRELLRNVVKHSRVQAAGVEVSQTQSELRVVVEDKGVGFEWQLSLFEPRAEGFGLWSVADRVREAAGEFTVDTAPGRGCRVMVVFPLGGAERDVRQATPRDALSAKN